MAKLNDETRILSFYKECIQNDYLDFDDEYANFKINVLAKKHGIISDEETFAKDDFDYVSKYYKDHSGKDMGASISELESVYNKNLPLISLSGIEKRVYELGGQLSSSQREMKDIERYKNALADRYYSENKQDHESWFWKGLGTELVTGSRVLGSLAVASVNEKNRQIDEQNKQLKHQIENQVNNDPRFQMNKQQYDLYVNKNKLKELDSAYVSSNKNYLKYIGYRIDSWGLNPAIGFASVKGKFWLKEKPKMPRDIPVSLDGTCKAVIYRKADLSVIAEILIPLPFLGVGCCNDNSFFGVQRGVWAENINKEDYGIELIDFNICAIEEKTSSVVNATSEGNMELADRLLYNDLNRNVDVSSITSLMKTISLAQNIDSTIDGKDSFINGLKIKLDELVAKKAEDESIAEDNRISEERRNLSTLEDEYKEFINNSSKLRKTAESVSDLLSFGLNIIAGIKTDGTIYISEKIKFDAEKKYQDVAPEVKKWKEIVSVCSYDRNIIGITRDGNVLSFGKNSFGVLNVRDWKNVARIDMSLFMTTGIKRDGTVLVCGDVTYKGSDGSISRLDISSWRGIIKVIHGDDTIYGLTDDGKVLKASKYDEPGMHSIVFEDVRDVVNDGSLCAVLKNDGTVRSENPNTDEICKNWKGVVEIKGLSGAVAALFDDGVVRIANPSDEQNISEEWNDIVQIATDNRKALVGLKKDCSIVYNNYINIHRFDRERVNSSKYIGLCGGEYVVAIKKNGEFDLLTNVSDSFYGDIPLTEWKMFNNADCIYEERQNCLEEEKRRLLDKMSSISGILAKMKKKEIMDQIKIIDDYLAFVKQKTM